MGNISEKLKSNRVIYLIGVYVKIIYFDIFYESYRRFGVGTYIRLFNPKKFNKIKEFKNKHVGERCFIVATGPSLTFEDLDFIKGEYSFGVNSIVKILDKTEWRPTYLGIQDLLVYDKIESDIAKSGLPTVFTSDLLKKKYASAKDFVPYFHDTCFHSVHGQIVPLRSNFSSDASKVVYDGYSITYSMLQLAVYMGFKEIYLLGVDCNYDVNGAHHFVESGFYDKQASNVGERMIFAFSLAKKYADKNGISIINSSRGGMLEVFERKLVDSIYQVDRNE